jgi:3-deoxy-D-manno-octulosonic-acid transferase
LHELHLVAAQTEEDAMRLAGLGNRAIPTMGNLKFDIAAPPAQLETGRRLRELFGAERPIFLAASTREGEEELLLNALRHLKVENLLVVIVPRHPQRFDEVAELITQQGLGMQRRSADEGIAAETQVVLGDSMGEMFAYYTACDVAFIGGSLLPFGGQNLIEACTVGKPVLIGPHMYNFAQASELAIACGAATQVSHADELVNQLNVLLHDAQQRERMSEAGKRFVSENQGATQCAVRHIVLAINESSYNEIVSSQARFKD